MFDFSYAFFFFFARDLGLNSLFAWFRAPLSLERSGAASVVETAEGYAKTRRMDPLTELQAATERNVREAREEREEAARAAQAEAKAQANAMAKEQADAAARALEIGGGLPGSIACHPAACSATGAGELGADLSGP